MGVEKIAVTYSARQTGKHDVIKIKTSNGVEKPHTGKLQQDYYLGLIMSEERRRSLHVAFSSTALCVETTMSEWLAASR